MLSVTTRQIDVLRAIARHQNLRHVSPTIRELADRLSIKSTNGVNDHLIALESKGLIVREPMLARTIQITDLGRQLLDGEAHVFDVRPRPTESIAKAERAVLIAADRWLYTTGKRGDKAEDRLVLAIESLRAAQRGLARSIGAAEQ